MTLSDAIDAELPFLRAEAIARMTSRVDVHRKTGGTTTDTQGYEVPQWSIVHYDLPFRLGASTSGDGGSRAVTIGGATFREATGVGNFPWDTLNLADDDLIEVRSGEWAGSVFRVVEATKKDQATARRVPVVEVPRPEEWP